MVDSPIVLCSSWRTSGRMVHTGTIFWGSLGSPRGLEGPGARGVRGNSIMGTAWHAVVKFLIEMS